MYLPLHKILGEWLSLSICQALCQLLGKPSSSETLCPYIQENVKSLPKENQINTIVVLSPNACVKFI